jgi:hypothetical protein
LNDQFHSGKGRLLPKTSLMSILQKPVRLSVWG